MSDEPLPPELIQLILGATDERLRLSEHYLELCKRLDEAVSKAEYLKLRAEQQAVLVEAKEAARVLADLIRRAREAAADDTRDE